MAMHLPSLPSSSYSPLSGYGSSSSSDGALTFREQLANAARRANMRASEASSAASSVFGRAEAAIERNVPHGDGVIATVARNSGTFAGGVAVGMLNASETGVRFHQWAYRLVKLPTVVFAAGVVARGLGADRNSPRVRAINSTMMRTMFPILGESLGEGIMGLSYAFLHAGAKQVVSTLWSIDDAKSKELMVVFYKELMRNGGNAAAALRQSQLTVMRQPHNSEPYYWAGFELTSRGESRISSDSNKDVP